MKVINEVRDNEAEAGNGSGQQCVLKIGHVGSGMILIDNFIVIITARNLGRGSYMENLVQAIPARLYLERIREHDKQDDGQLPNSDEYRCRGIHGDDISADIGTKGQIAKECDDLICHNGTTNGRPNNDVHALLRVRLQFIEDREQILGTRERKDLHRERRDEVWFEMDEMDFASWICTF